MVRVACASNERYGKALAGDAFSTRARPLPPPLDAATHAAPRHRVGPGRGEGRETSRQIAPHPSRQALPTCEVLPIPPLASPPVRMASVRFRAAAQHVSPRLGARETPPRRSAIPSLRVEPLTSQGRHVARPPCAVAPRRAEVLNPDSDRRTIIYGPSHDGPPAILALAQ